MGGGGESKKSRAKGEGGRGGTGWWAYISGEVHLARVDLEDVPARLLVGRGELDLAVDAARADEGRVERLDLVGGEDDLSYKESTRTWEKVREGERTGKGKGDRVGGAEDVP